MTSVLQYLNFEGSRWSFFSWFPHLPVLGKYLCLQNLVDWPPWKRMSFIYLQEIWLQTLFHLNSFSPFQQLLKQPLERGAGVVCVTCEWDSVAVHAFAQRWVVPGGYNTEFLGESNPWVWRGVFLKDFSSRCDLSAQLSYLLQDIFEFRRSLNLGITRAAFQ